MKVRLIAIGMILGAGSALVTSNAISQSTQAQEQQPETQLPSPEEMAQMMEQWMQMMQPGEHHKALDPLVGEWDVTIRTWWEGPAGEPMESTGSATTEWILGGRFVQEKLDSTFQMPTPEGEMQEMPYHGLGMTGYDNFRNTYVSAWLDDFSTSMVTMTGSMGPAGEVLVMYGQMDEPMLNVIGRYVKYVMRLESRDRHVFEMYDLHAGEDYKVMEVVYERK